MCYYLFVFCIQLANTKSDIETGNMQMVVQEKNITLCLWANLNKNPRYILRNKSALLKREGFFL